MPTAFVSAAAAVGLAVGWTLLVGWAKPQPIAVVGQTVEGLGYQVRIESMREDAKGSGPFVPVDGAKYVVVVMTVKNTSRTESWFAPVVQTYLRDAAGTDYAMAPAVITNPINAGAIKPGGVVRGEVSYWVPADAMNLVFHFDPAWQRSSPASIALY